jgi:hypothetical protein
MFNAPELFFGGTEGVGSRFRVLRSRTCFRRYRGRPVPFSCFALVYPWNILKISSWVNENKYRILIIKRKRRRKRRGAKERAHRSERSLMNSGATLFVPQGNTEHKIKGINTPPSSIHSAWVTAERIEREERSLGCHHVIIFFSDKWDPPGSPLQTALTA